MTLNLNIIGDFLNHKISFAVTLNEEFTLKKYSFILSWLLTSMSETMLCKSTFISKYAFWASGELYTMLSKQKFHLSKNISLFCKYEVYLFQNLNFYNQTILKEFDTYVLG